MFEVGRELSPHRLVTHISLTLKNNDGSLRTFEPRKARGRDKLKAEEMRGEARRRVGRGRG